MFFKIILKHIIENILIQGKLNFFLQRLNITNVNHYFTSHNLCEFVIKSDIQVSNVFYGKKSINYVLKSTKLEQLMLLIKLSPMTIVVDNH